MAHVYLAGPISGQNYDTVNDWRNYAILELAKFGIIGVSPMRAKEELKGFATIDEKLVHTTNPLCTDKSITTRDRFDAYNSDLVLVNLLNADKVSIGTMVEYGWADAYRKPVITIMEKGSIHDHVMIREISGFRAQTLDEGIELAVKILSPYRRNI